MPDSPAARRMEGRRATEADVARPHADPDAWARALCLRQLDVRSRTRTELARYLTRKGVPDDAASRVLDRFASVGLVDDVALAMAFASSRQAEQGLARRAIAAKLKQRGVDDDVIAQAVATVEPDDEWVAARRLVAKRRRALVGLDQATQVRRLVGLLARKGYAPTTAYQVVREAIASASLVDDGLTDHDFTADMDVG